ncbi:MAG: tyrosine transporter, partial [Parachlamydia sp.]|nr:tyrosine transporter [Parachlamydia sp.]
ASLLVAGCCIGAGMLGLPILSGMAGFQPTLVMFILSWLFMVATGLLLLEVNLWFPDDVSLVTMAGRTLGGLGKAVAWGGFLFLFYALMVAYIAAIGELISDFSLLLFHVQMPSWFGSLIGALLFGIAVYLGTGAVDAWNRYLMIGLVVSYALLLILGSQHVDRELLKHRDWPAVVVVIPAMIISFGYHNLIPTLKTYLEGDLPRLRLTILIGTAIPLIIYLFWEWLILGLIPVEGAGGFREALGQGEMTTRALKNAVGSSWVVDLAHAFAFFAIVTSFLGVALSFVDFLADGFHIKKDARGKALLCGLVLGLPFIFALIYPKIFLTALKYAGSFGAVTLFGLLPAAMAWMGRYRRGIKGVRVLPGGRFSLILIIAVALTVMGLQLYVDLGGSYG